MYSEIADMGDTVLARPQALKLGSGKDIVMCCTVVIHTAMVLSIPRQGSGPSLRG